MAHLILALILGLSSLACSDMNSRPETADKWKPILVEVNAPLSTEAPYQPTLLGDPITLDFYVIAPAGEKAVTAEVISPDSAPFTLPLSQLNLTERTDTSYPGLELLRFRASSQLPTQESLAALNPSLSQAELVRFRYGMQFSANGRSIPVYGDFPAYANAEVLEASWSLRGSTITGPDEELELGTTVELEAEINNPQGEAIKVGWYVSAGELKNRRASRTEWELPGPGTYTAILTARGKQSRSAQLSVRQITVP